MPTRTNTKKRAKLVKDIVAVNYEPGRQDRCLLWVYRNVVQKIYPMSERTFFRYLSTNTEEEKKEEDKNQLKLF